MITPLLGDDRLDPAGLERRVELVLAGGVHDLFLLGTTGEGLRLSYRLRQEMIERTCRQIRQRAPAPAVQQALDDQGAHHRGITFAAVSEDEGQTWPHRRLVSDDGRGQELDGGAWTRGFTMDASHAEPRGYLCSTQAPDGMIHLLSSAVHYQFNLAWVKARPPATP